MSWFRKKHRPPSPSGLLIISSGGLGDTILLSLIMARFAALAAPGEKVTLLLRQESEKVAFLFAENIIILPVDYTALQKKRSYRRRIIDQLYAANYRAVISTDFLRHPKLDDVMVKACAAGEVAGMVPRSWPKYDQALQKNRALYSRLYDSGPVHKDKVLRWAGFADWLSGHKTAAPLVRLPAGQIAPAKPYPRPTVILVPFSAVKAKQSPPEIFQAIIDHLQDAYDFVIAGAPNDLAGNPEYAALLDAPNISFDAALFRDLAAKLTQAALVVAVDTAAMHLAVAVGAPTVCLASAAYVNEITPYAPEITPDNVRFVYQSMACEGCLGSCDLPLEAARFPCVARLDQAKILAAIDAVLLHE